VKSVWLLVVLSGCDIYHRGFDCPPGKGVGCKATSEILEMIVEKERDPHSKDPFDDGHNLFILPEESA